MWNVLEDYEIFDIGDYSQVRLYNFTVHPTLNSRVIEAQSRSKQAIDIFAMIKQGIDPKDWRISSS
ncbi:hypothetical protein KK470_29705, partial [Klebsiella pneumoniae]|uniref:hypothetical protein n=1 Tax=Klebsiella pneumoniae TaxID=573 RepID=UPI001BE05487